MGTIKSIASERFDKGENGFSNMFRNAMFDTAIDKFDALFGD